MTKKLTLLISLTSSVLFALFLYSKFADIPSIFGQESKPMAVLNYILGSNSKAVSFDPLDSDSLVNNAHLEQLVGTLVKHGESGKIEPYLAENWTISNDSKTWKFKLRQNLTCEDGEKISPAAFKKSIERSLKYYLEKMSTNIPILQDLKGFSKLKTTGAVEGIVISSDEIKFSFTAPVRSGLLEYLAMPYYGYYCSSNYDDSSNWKSPKKIVSSSTYSVLSVSKEGTSVELQIRKDWFNAFNTSPQKVNLLQMDLKAALTTKLENKIVYGYHEQGIEVPQNLEEMKSVPDWSFSVVLSPSIQNVFDSLENRKEFFNRFRNAQKIIPFVNDDAELTNFFFPNAKTELGEVSSPGAFSTGGKNKSLKIIFSDHLNHHYQAYFKDLFRKVFNGTQINYEVSVVDRSDPNWFVPYISNEHYDIRVAGVSAGSSIENWAIEMMFCSKLGIHFPDPDNLVQKIVNDFDAGKIDLAQYAKRFNDTLHATQTVIPVFNRRFSWFVSKNIDATISPVTPVPRFEYIKIKK